MEACSLRGFPLNSDIQSFIRFTSFETMCVEKRLILSANVYLLVLMRMRAISLVSAFTVFCLPLSGKDVFKAPQVHVTIPQAPKVNVPPSLQKAKTPACVKPPAAHHRSMWQPIPAVSHGTACSCSPVSCGHAFSSGCRASCPVRQPACSCSATFSGDGGLIGANMCACP